MVVNEKGILRRIIHRYLADEYPASLEEFKATFDPIYETLVSQQKHSEDETILGNMDGISLDAGIMGQTVISLACVVGFVLLKAALKDSTRRDLPKLFDKIQASLSKKTGRPDVVRAIRERIQGILQSL